MKPPRLRLPSHVREKRDARRGRVLPSTCKKTNSTQWNPNKNPARILPTEFNFGPEFEVVMSLQGKHFSATTVLSQYAHMLHGWKPPPRVYSADKSGPNSSTARVHKNEGKDKSKNQDMTVPAQGPQHKPPPVPPAPKMQEKPIVVPSPVCEVPRAFVPAPADAGSTAKLPQGREAKMILATKNFLEASANRMSEKRKRVPTNHTRY